MKPNYVHFRVGLDEFAGYFKKFIKEQKGWEIECEFAFEGPDDQGHLGDLYFEIDLDSTSQDVLDAIESWYGDFEIFDDILEEIFGKGVEHDFNPDTEEVYIFVDYDQYHQTKK